MSHATFCRSNVRTISRLHCFVLFCSFLNITYGGYTCKRGYTCEKGTHLKKLGPTWKKGSHLIKWVTLGKMGHTWKNGSHMVKWVWTWKKGHTYKDGLHVRKKVKTLVFLGKTHLKYCREASTFASKIATSPIIPWASKILGCYKNLSFFSHRGWLNCFSFFLKMFCQSNSYALLGGKEILKNVYFTGRVTMKRFLKCNFANLHLAVAKCSLKFMFNWFVLQVAKGSFQYHYIMLISLSVWKRFRVLIDLFLHTLAIQIM